MEIALGNKGPVAPPPRLDQPSQTTVERVAAWDDVIAAAHWDLSQQGQVDGVDFYVGENELGHIHLDGWVHLATNRELRNQLVAHELADPFPYSGYEHWVQYKIGNASEADHAAWLFNLNYRRLTNFSLSELLQEIRITASNPDKPLPPHQRPTGVTK